MNHGDDGTRAPAPDRAPGGGEHDAWLRAALRHAPDAAAAPPETLRAAILAEARATLAPVAPASRRGAAAPPSSGLLAPLAALWDWLARPPVAAGFATVAMATVIGVLWHDRPLEEALPEVGRPAPSAAPAPTEPRADVSPQATTTAPGAVLPPPGATMRELPAAPPPAVATMPHPAGRDTTTPGAEIRAPATETEAAARPPAAQAKQEARAAARATPTERPVQPAPDELARRAEPRPFADEGGTAAESAAARLRSRSAEETQRELGAQTRRDASPREALRGEAMQAPAAADAARPVPSARRAGSIEPAQDTARARDDARSSNSAPAPAPTPAPAPAPAPSPAPAPAPARTPAPAPAPAAAPAPAPAPAPADALSRAERPTGLAVPGPAPVPFAAAAPAALARAASPLGAVLAALDAEPSRWSVTVRARGADATGRRPVDPAVRRWLADLDAAAGTGWRPAGAAERSEGDSGVAIVLHRDERPAATVVLGERSARLAVPAAGDVASRASLAPLPAEVAARLAAALPR